MNVSDASLVRTPPSPGKSVTRIVGPCEGDGRQSRGKSSPSVVAPPVLLVGGGALIGLGIGVAETTSTNVITDPLRESMWEDSA